MPYGNRCWRRSGPIILRATMRPRHSVSDHLGVAARRHAEVHRHPAARRQQRRGRDARADGARQSRHGRPRADHHPARHHQRRPVLRRRNHHAIALGAIGDRRHRDHHPDLPALRRSDHGSDPARAVFRAVLRDGARGVVLRTHHACLVHRPRARRDLAHLASAHRPLCVQSVLWRDVPDPPRDHRAPDPRCRVPGGDRLRGALCRSRSFRARADPYRMALRRAAGADHQLSRSGRPRA